MKKLIHFAGCFFLFGPIAAQEWTDMLSEPGRNFYEIRSEFNAYWANEDKTAKGKGYKQFRRWEHFMEPRVYPSGKLWLPSTNMENFAKFKGPASAEKSMTSSTTWTAIGPMGAMTGSASGFPRKAGRDNFITFHPTAANTYWVGAPAGGLWKTTDNGVTWTTTTDYLTVTGCSDLAIDPLNPNTMFLATGDGDGGDTYSIGVLKSIDGGVTWSTTGLTFGVNQVRQIRRLIINPVNPQVLFAATNIGIYRTTDGGTTWALPSSGNMYDVEFKPGNPQVIYAAGTSFLMSTDGGINFSTVNIGLSNSSNRMSIAVTEADTNYVYVLASASANNGLLGVYRSTDGAVSFTTTATTPNLLANACNGTGTGGQGWYDLTIAASPLNKNEVVVGGVNVWRSTNAGVNWGAIACWIGTGNPPYVHADQHELDYNSSGVLYSANDGGIFSYTGTSWTDRTGSRNIAQIYKVGLSTLSPNLWITGHQDNGSNIYTGTTYKASMAGDGMDCFIDRTNDANMFASFYDGDFRRSVNGGVTWLNANTGMTGTAAWVAPWKQDPVTNNLLYAGRSELFKSTDLGQNWTQAGTMGGSGTIVEFAIAPSNNQVIYVIRGTSIRKTINGGTSWALSGTGVPTSIAAPSFITIDPSDPNTAWVTLSGYSAGNKVFQTTNGGTSWTNISSNLPNLPANCSVYQQGSNDRIYIGMDVGVYYKDNSSTQWTLYNSGLPNTPISDLEISPAAPTLLRAATFGRGVWQVDLIQTTTAPTSSFSYVGSLCAGVPKQFTDNSNESPTSWLWSITPATGVAISSSTVAVPTITFQNAGTYTVSLTASNGFGPGTPAIQSVTVNPIPVLSFNASSEISCIGDPVQLEVEGATTYTWMPGNIKTSTVGLTALTNINYTVTGSASGCSSKSIYSLTVSECAGMKEFDRQNNFSVFPNPAKQQISVRNYSGSNYSVELSIIDITGKIIFHQAAKFSKETPEHIVDISSFPKGMYILKIDGNDSEKQLIKLIKE